MIKKGICLLMAVCCAFLLSGCKQQSTREEGTPAATLRPAETRYTAPDGDEIIAEPKDYRIYLLSKDGLSLVPRSISLDAMNLNDTVERLVEGLFADEGDNKETVALGNGRKLELYGPHPIEISDGVCTVNLAVSALNLNPSVYYKNCVAIATTLCELDEINYVNVLVKDRSVALDTQGYLPMGTLIAHRGENLPVLWEQMESKKAPLNKNQNTVRLDARATLYYPLPDSRGVACTIRMVNFDGQTPRQLTLGLLDEISNVRRSMSGGQNFPELRTLLLHDPVISEQENGERILTLSLREDTEEVLKSARTDRACFTAAMVSTLTTFIPGIDEVCIRIGDKPVTELTNPHFDTVTALGGLFRRSQVEQFLTSSVTVYFARNGILCECERPVARRSADSLRAQLCALMEGPDMTEQEEGIMATLPDTVREDDILGISADGDTLLVNLSESFRAEIQARGPETETLLCYSMVNTLCRNTGMKRVCFFFEGEQVEYIAGTIYWAGEFMYNIGLAEKGLG